MCPLHDCGDCAFGERGFDVIVAVEPLAANGEEQVARLQGPRVNGVAGGNRLLSEVTGGRHELGGA